MYVRLLAGRRVGEVVYMEYDDARRAISSKMAVEIDTTDLTPRVGAMPAPEILQSTEKRKRERK